MAQHFAVEKGSVAWVGQDGVSLFVRYRQRSSSPVIRHELVAIQQAREAFSSLFNLRSTPRRLPREIAEWKSEGGFVHSTPLKESSSLLSVFQSLLDAEETARRVDGLMQQVKPAAQAWF